MSTLMPGTFSGPSSKLSETQDVKYAEEVKFDQVKKDLDDASSIGEGQTILRCSFSTKAELMAFAEYLDIQASPKDNISHLRDEIIAKAIKAPNMTTMIKQVVEDERAKTEMGKLETSIKTKPYEISISKLNLAILDVEGKALFLQKEGVSELIENMRTLQTNVVLPVVRPSEETIASRWYGDDRYDVLDHQGEMIVQAAREAGLTVIQVFLIKEESNWDIAKKQAALVNKIIEFESLDGMKKRVSNVLTEAKEVITDLKKENHLLKADAQKVQISAPRDAAGFAFACLYDDEGEGTLNESVIENVKTDTLSESSAAITLKILLNLYGEKGNELGSYINLRELKKIPQQEQKYVRGLLEHFAFSDQSFEPYVLSEYQDTLVEVFADAPLESIQEVKAENTLLRQQLVEQAAVVVCSDVLDYVVDGIKGLRGLNTKFIGDKSGKMNFTLIFTEWKKEGLKPKQIAQRLFEERKIGRIKSKMGVVECVPLSPQTIGKFMREYGV